MRANIMGSSRRPWFHFASMVQNGAWVSQLLFCSRACSPILVGNALGTKLVEIGHEVTMGSRSPSSLSPEKASKVQCFPANCLDGDRSRLQSHCSYCYARVLRRISLTK